MQDIYIYKKFSHPITHIPRTTVSSSLRKEMMANHHIRPAIKAEQMNVFATIKALGATRKKIGPPE
jgi:hypothetical protein